MGGGAARARRRAPDGRHGLRHAAVRLVPPGLLLIEARLHTEGTEHHGPQQPDAQHERGL